MSLLVTGSIGIDTVTTPFGKSENCIGGSAVYFAMAASFFSPVRFVGVVGDDHAPGNVRKPGETRLEEVAFLAGANLEIPCPVDVDRACHEAREVVRKDDPRCARLRYPDRDRIDSRMQRDGLRRKKEDRAQHDEGKSQDQVPHNAPPGRRTAYTPVSAR